jgi:5-bromo-4-chloroindolyl phosphate hydrolysis protein
VADAFEGYALSKGIKQQKKRGNLSETDIKNMRRELEEAKRLHKEKYGNA